LPGHARRLALWMARRARANALRPGRTSPLKPGRAPGAPKRPTHDVHDILGDVHYFAREALKPPDTS
ncbi:MAG: hypothetical protein Q8Q62_18895, partial [Mesorhizobium sp.]|nr:hypothetical protein [Mesorhizobium sp.]